MKNDCNKNLYDILTSNNIVDEINKNLDYLIEIISELENMIGFEHKHSHHHLDVWNHTLLALSLSDNNFEIRLCLLLHDIGKPFSFTEGEVRHFKNHSKVSAMMSRNILTRLDFNENFINEVCYLIENHDTAINKEDINDNYNLAYKRYLIQKCDALAHHPNKLEKRKEYLQKVKTMF